MTPVAAAASAQASEAAAAVPVAKIVKGKEKARSSNKTASTARQTPAGRARTPASRKRKAAEADIAVPATKKRKGPKIHIREPEDEEAVDVSASDGVDGSSDEEESASGSDVLPEEDENFGGQDDAEAEEEVMPAAPKPRKKGKAVESQFEVAIPRWTMPAAKLQAPTNSAPAAAPAPDASLPPRKPVHLHHLRIDSDDDKEATLDQGPAPATPCARHVTPFDANTGTPDGNAYPEGPQLVSQQALPSTDERLDAAPSVAVSRAVSVSSLGPTDSTDKASGDNDGKAAGPSLVAPKGSKVKIREQPKAVTKVIQRANKNEMPEFICFKNAFPTQLERPPLLRQALLDAAKALGDKDIEMRMLGDPGYADHMARIPDGRISNLRGKVKLAADQCATSAYELPTIPAATFVQHIHKLMDPKDHPMLFTYPTVGAAAKERFDMGRPYCHPAIITVLQNCFFGTKAAARFNSEKYNIGPNPVPTLQVYAALEAYALGSQASHIEFEANKYTPIYNDHVDVLEQIELDDEHKFSALMVHLYKAASGMTKGASARRVDTSKIAASFD
ncbi:hypothetical protein FA95DRAFT_1609122 [Auriscalpium vulgare]|uniref:Uncharacterized protein n=1 Tax=Auriscalpium vulgare TaxID=40419 RepID=A0ACB8RII7_9AGAM|nr:hypothetical protein FA95DRAFT_1609122 [Auriscalpium vulgare]